MVITSQIQRFFKYTFGSCGRLVAQDNLDLLSHWQKWREVKMWVCCGVRIGRRGFRWVCQGGEGQSSTPGSGWDGTPQTHTSGLWNPKKNHSKTSSLSSLAERTQEKEEKPKTRLPPQHSLSLPSFSNPFAISLKVSDAPQTQPNQVSNQSTKKILHKIRLPKKENN